MKRPNILVIMSDQMKATASHLYGNTFCKTPALERLGEQGVRFQHAYTPHPLCVPARVSLWTSQYSHTHGARRNETLMPGRATHAFQLLQNAGYHCGLIGKNHCFERSEDLALFDTWCEIDHRGLPAGVRTKGLPWFRPAEAINAAHATRREMPQQSPRFGYAATDYPLTDYSTGLVAGQTVRFLERQQDHGEPFALWVSFPDPHDPYEAPEEYVAQIPADETILPPWRQGEFEQAPETNRVLYEIMGMEADPLGDIIGVLRVYYAMVRFLDDGVAKIVAALDRLGLREETIVVFCSDHGDFAGEHRMTAKGGVFYDALTRVPLIVSWPGRVPAGVVDDSMVNLVDIVPTLLKLTGLPMPRSMQGAPLPTVTDAVPRDEAFSEYGAGGPPFTMENLKQLDQPYGWQALMESLQWREAEGRRKMVRAGQWKYVHDPLGDRHELYDLREDPWEHCNVVDRPEHKQTVDSLRRRILDWSIRTEGAWPVPLPDNSS